MRNRWLKRIAAAQQSESGAWVDTGKVGKLISTGEPTREQERFDAQGKSTGERRWVDGAGNMVEDDAGPLPREQEQALQATIKLIQKVDRCRRGECKHATKAECQLLINQLDNGTR